MTEQPRPSTKPGKPGGPAGNNPKTGYNSTTETKR